MVGAVRGLRALAGAIWAAAAIGAAGGAAAQSFPARDLVIVCAFPPGSGSDTLVRFFAEKIRPMVGRTVIVENRFGAGGSIAAEHVARAKPDGHTMLMHAASAIAANMFLYKQPGIDAKKALTVVATVNQQPFMMAVDATKPWKSVQEVTAFLLEKGDKASYATSATAGTIFGEMYKAATGVKAVEVVYRVGAESLNDQLSGRIDYGMFDPVYTMSQVRAGRLRALAVSTPQRMQAVPDIPTMSELGFKEIELKTWFAVMLPAGAPAEAGEKINAWFNAALRTDEARAFLNGFGGDPFITTPGEAQALYEREFDLWSRYVKLARIEPK